MASADLLDLETGGRVLSAPHKQSARCSQRLVEAGERLPEEVERLRRERLIPVDGVAVDFPEVRRKSGVLKRYIEILYMRDLATQLQSSFLKELLKSGH